MPEFFSQAAEETRNRIAQQMLAQQLAQAAPAGEIFPHSPAAATFDFSPGDMPTGSLPEATATAQTQGLFDPGNTMQGGNLPTGRDAFDNESVQDWGGVFSPDPTMTAPSDFATPAPFDDSAVPSDNAPVTPGYNMPEFNPDLGLPSAPNEQDASLSAPGGALGIADLGSLGIADLGEGADSSGGDNTGGSVG